MSQQPYLTAPVPSTKMPGGIPYIIGNEAAERFSYYGMRAVLMVFMTKYLLDRQGNSAPLPEAEATMWYHMFTGSAYFFPIFGAIISDAWWGKYNTILRVSVIYCLGHLALALDHTRIGLFVGLGLIAIGAGGIKPCVSAHVGDQFGKSNAHLQTKGFGWFYLSINFGSYISSELTPWLLELFPQWLKTHLPERWLAAIGPPERLGPDFAFGVPGVLMLVATLVFWMGRHKFVHIPARGWAEVKRSLGGETKDALIRVSPIFLCIMFFWSVYDQSGSTWVKQAEKMDLHFLGREWLPSQVQAVNPILILILVPFLSYVGYPLINSVFPLTPLRKMSIGLFVAVLASALIAIAQQRIDAGETPTVGWQMIAYVVITVAEIMVWVTCLEFSYTQAPRESKSFVMSVALLSIFLGNMFVMSVNWLFKDSTGALRITRTQYFSFFTILLLVVAVVFIFVAGRYREKTYLQEERPVGA